MSELTQAVLTLTLLAGSIVYFWPQTGGYWTWRRRRRASERVLMEDALKHVFHCEYRRQPASVDSLSGALEITRNSAADLLSHVEVRGLLTSDEKGLHLTQEGKAYALRIVRVHRLWEHYLAERTGMTETEWHREAERREHEITAADADLLAQQMGEPAYDPHGDPIPSASGDIRPRRGQPITTLAPGDIASVVHVEDEPEAVYAQLVAEGVHVGMRVEMMESSPTRVAFWAEGDEHVLAPILAGNISVIPVPKEEEAETSGASLASLEPGQEGKVLRISRTCRGLERRRLMDLGILPGTVIGVQMRSPGGDPTAYRVRGSSIALRKEQASHIQIEPDASRSTEAA
jgi:DtxR family Mn-dependent transcriptional regulator